MSNWSGSGSAFAFTSKRKRPFVAADHHLWNLELVNLQISEVKDERKTRI